MPSKAYPRSRRVAQQIQQALSELIRREVRDPRLGMVTLTDVQLSSDLSYAKVYFSVLGASADEAQGVLDAAAPMLRGPLGRALGIRHSPELRFVRDVMIAKGVVAPATPLHAINKLLNFEDDAVLFGYVTQPGMRAVAEALVGPGLLSIATNVSNKPPGVDGRHPLHQDLA